MRAALQEVMRGGLRPAAWALAALFAALTLGNTFLPPGAREIMVPLAGATSLMFGLAGHRFGKRLPPAGRVHPVATALAGLVLGNVLVHLALLPAPIRIIPVLLLIVGVGFFLLDTRWLAGTLAFVVVAFCVVAGAWLPPPIAWRDLAFWLLEATVLAGVIHVVRLRGLTKLVVAQMRAEKARREAMASNSELEAFSYSVSHDLRAPVRAIDYLSKAIVEDLGPSAPAESRALLQRLRVESSRMEQLIEDLLTLARSTGGALQEEEIDLTALSTSVIADLRMREPSRNVAVDIAPHLKVWGDPRLLRVVMENLLGNAWKYSSRAPAPHIEVGATRTPEREHAIYVRDNGAGFDMAQADRLFQPFQRLHSPSEYEGTGIGLATVSRIIQRHGGRVWAEGRPGEGATFFFTLPPGRRG